MEEQNKLSIKSGFLNLNLRDLFRGLIIAFGTALLPSLLVLFNQDHWPVWLEFRPYLQASISSCIVYLIKNGLTNEDGKFGELKDSDKDNI